jgi:hypothetical protein
MNISGDKLPILFPFYAQESDLSNTMNNYILLADK